ncbi:unnamed protein product [Rotaria sp. Silwood1]|nr:unnamed protein product [Rotaria sp. Silwood1]CAF1545078.1 unnamed protein product [Rotaria sp. Silwood1]
MTSSLFISQTWYDDRLSWTIDASNNNITVVMLPVKSLWIPDTMILNSADASGYLTVSDYSLASVYYTGHVYMILPALTIRTRCSFSVKYFPFDKQICSINLTSWSQGYNRIIYTENSSLVIDISGYNEHPLWRLNRTDVIVIDAADRAPFEDTYNAIISIQLYLERKPLFFIMNGIFACLILNFVTLLSYALSFVPQIALCMTCFMTYSVYSLNFSNLFPQQSQYLMMITLYFLLSIFWTLVSMVWFIMYNYFTTKVEMPKSLYSFCGLLQKVFFCYFPSSKTDDKTKQKNGVIVENGEVNKSGKAENAKASSTQTIECTSFQELSGLGVHRHRKVKIIENMQHSSVASTEAVTTNPIVGAPIDTVAFTSVKETSQRAKQKCNFCNRCESCQTDIDKDKVKNNNKKDIEARCNALNYFICFCQLLLMLISNMAVWLSMSK